MTDAILCGCTVCGKAFAASPHKSNKYCGMACYRAAQRAGTYKRGHGPEFHRAPCHHCGVTVERNPSTTRSGQQSDKVFCARACYDASRALITQARSTQCLRCKSEFIPSGRGTKYCSMACRRTGMKADPKHCLACGCFFTPVRLQKATGRYVSYSAGKTCSPSCHIAWIRDNPERKRKISIAFSRERHPGWQGGSHREGFRGHDWEEISEKARARAGRCCEHCGMTEADHLEKYRQRLHIHHLEPFHQHQNKQMANKHSNLVALCRSCHTKADWKWRKENPVQTALMLR
ncbi:hypothetical protein D3879_14685 [Pseudomonas cavernicola]|uniref:HNH nuclease domain-containing protein n=1 Tax=Pseudomonas cavernicola TaxID=2320866 RepID=A0A418XEZ9_9PSED|nr:hypothetical protein D3879_14685 [Pseudomonas cavernicola]